ncbi:MCE family protein [Nocardioides sp. WL0053]|uniref:MCE family protein n=1 Tax=Nocardioides jiangsuensis TaxID=2866161 RepID=A0ABS7RI70_9ACTN|nr:MCE family protein [Nocardioides jiangsuensis]MBY9074729.1 MCE family protein [Nocardioides jiangsuensis]
MSVRSVFAAGSNRVLGVAFLVLLLTFVWGTYAIFTKKFVDVVPVTLKTSNIGLQLPALADVKIRGVIVGEVREIASDGEGARLELALDPAKTETIPANVTARIIPKTLFGEKYVALQVPARPDAEPIAADDVIEEAEVSIEVEKLLNDLYPFLRTVQPAELNYTLTAIADALEGRGEAIGNNLVVLDRYLERTNPQLPELIEDLRLLSQVSDDYAGVMPELARLLRNGVTTGNTFVEQEAKIQALFNDVAGFSTTSRDFLEQNGENIIRLGEVSEAQLPLFAEYAPQYPCLLEGMADWIPRMNSGWRGHTLHINLETLKKQPTGYGTADDPEYDANNGPHCETLPSPPYSQANPGPQPRMSEVDDGVEDPHVKFRRRPAPALDLTSGFAGTAAERSVVAALAAPVMGVPTDDVPDVATLLLGPLARGTEVSVR